MKLFMKNMILTTFPLRQKYLLQKFLRSTRSSPRGSLTKSAWPVFCSALRDVENQPALFRATLRRSSLVGQPWCFLYSQFLQKSSKTTQPHKTLKTISARRDKQSKYILVFDGQLRLVLFYHMNHLHCHNLLPLKYPVCSSWRKHPLFSSSPDWTGDLSTLYRRHFQPPEKGEGGCWWCSRRRVRTPPLQANLWILWTSQVDEHYS